MLLRGFIEDITNFDFHKIIKTGFQWTTSLNVLLVVLMSSGQGLDQGFCVSNISCTILPKKEMFNAKI